MIVDYLTWEDREHERSVNEILQSMVAPTIEDAIEIAELTK
jgi:hypothetical protein